ncbi:GAF domain-containing protein [Pedosphaera parvula]|uniref:histidine kinase n=1 Tax=Pedosphaera parvula (strain Ellin514) TaxID=320771 RepID=B9XEL2_PEDPL|nr:GAF domain-containing protein [Pedosphaera parvula]EEF61726.1 GAF sensor signal transduction histidine kinase [Pedosphaera parvula Ellin514]
MNFPNRTPGDELADLKVRYARLDLLYQVGNVIHSTLDPQEALQLIIDQAVRVMRASSGSVVLINPTTNFLEIHASMGLPPNAAALKLRVGEGITGWVAIKGKTVRSGDVTQDPRYIQLRQNVRSELAVPMLVNGEIRGVINVDSDRNNAFSEGDQELLEALALSASRVIQNTWLYEQLRLKARLFEMLASVGQTINSALNLDDALHVITREACGMMQAKMCSLLMLQESGEWLELRASHGAGEVYMKSPKLSMNESLLGTVVRRRKPIQVENVQTSSRYQRAEIARQEGLVALLSVPLIFANECIGTLSIYTGRPYKFSNEEVRILSALAELSAIAIEKARLYERIVDVEEQLRQNEKLSALGLLAAEVAHEIRNPLTVMKMLYHSLDLKFPAGDPRNKDAEIIGQKMELLNKIVEQILDFARTTEPTFAEVHLNELIEELGLLVRHKLRNQNVQFIHHLDSDLPAVMADATHLEQAFLNLILNAAQAMPNGGKLTITTRAIEGGGKTLQVAVDFKDTGEGMTEEQRRRAFSSVLSTTKAKGTGLGLAIVGRVIETHHGELKLKSAPGRGTTISVILPLA